MESQIESIKEMDINTFLNNIEKQLYKKIINEENYEKIRKNFFQIKGIEDTYDRFRILKHNFYTNKFKKIENYTIEELKNNFEVLENINQDFDNEEILENSLVIICRSKNFEDLHKAIKYGVWTSGTHNNIKIMKSLNNEIPVYIIYTVLNSNHFYGVAKVTQKPIMNVFYNYWSEPAKWKGLIRIEWVYLSLLNFDNIILKEDDIFITELTDGKSLSPENAYKIFENFKKNMNDEKYTNDFLLRKFNGLDKNEQFLRENRDLMVETDMMKVYGDNTDANNNNFNKKEEEIEKITVSVVQKKRKKKK